MANVAISGDTSGAVTLTVPATAGTNTITLGNQTGTLWAAGPAFSAYSSAGNNLSSGAWTKVTFDTEEYDTNNNFSSSRFTPTVAGYYQVSSTIDCDAGVGITTMTRCVLGVYKNGSIYKCGAVAWSLGTGTRELSPTVTSLVYCNGSTDYIEIYCNVTTGSGTPVTGGGSSFTWFNGSLIRGA